MNENKTWDGFGKFNNAKVEKKPELTKEEELNILRKLEDFERKG